MKQKEKSDPSAATRRLVRAEVTDNMVALNVGDNVYKPFFKGAIVEVDPITFRNLERDGRLKASPSSTAVPAVGTTKRQSGSDRLAR